MLNYTSSLNFKSSLSVYLHNAVCARLQMQSFKPTILPIILPKQLKIYYGEKSTDVHKSLKENCHHVLNTVIFVYR